jgi:hypothetical protein
MIKFRIIYDGKMLQVWDSDRKKFIFPNKQVTGTLYNQACCAVIEMKEVKKAYPKLQGRIFVDSIKK